MQLYTVAYCSFVSTINNAIETIEITISTYTYLGMLEKSKAENPVFAT